MNDGPRFSYLVMLLGEHPNLPSGRESFSLKTEHPGKMRLCWSPYTYLPLEIYSKWQYGPDKKHELFKLYQILG